MYFTSQESGWMTNHGDKRIRSSQNETPKRPSLTQPEKFDEWIPSLETNTFLPAGTKRTCIIFQPLICTGDLFALWRVLKIRWFAKGYLRLQTWLILAIHSWKFTTEIWWKGVFTDSLGDSEATVDGSEIRLTTWDVYFPENNGINYQPQLVSRFLPSTVWFCK